jgi:hypothetical protein
MNTSEPKGLDLIAYEAGIHRHRRGQWTGVIA